MPRHRMNQNNTEELPSFQQTPLPEYQQNHEPEKILSPKEQNVNNNLSDGVFTIESAPKDGTNIVIMESLGDVGVMSYWRKTRSRKDGKWELSGRWSHTLSHAPIGFEPKYWKDQDSVEWKIDTSIIDKQRIIELERQVQELSKR